MLSRSPSDQVSLSGTSQEFTCRVGGFHGEKDPTIQWFTIVNGVETPANSDLSRGQSSYTITPQVKDDDMEIKCSNPESGKV